MFHVERIALRKEFFKKNAHKIAVGTLLVAAAVSTAVFVERFTRTADGSHKF